MNDHVIQRPGSASYNVLLDNGRHFLPIDGERKQFSCPIIYDAPLEPFYGWDSPLSKKFVSNFVLPLTYVSYFCIY